MQTLLLFGLFMLSEAYPELLDVTRLARHLWGSPNSPFGPGGLDRLARGATCKVYRFIAPGAQGTIFEGTIFQILVQRVQFCQIVPF